MCSGSEAGSYLRLIDLKVEEKQYRVHGADEDLDLRQEPLGLLDPLHLTHNPQPLPQPPNYRNVQRFRGGLVFKAHGLLYHSTLGWRVMSCVTQRKAQGPSRTCNESKEEEYRVHGADEHLHLRQEPLSLSLSLSLSL